MNQKQKILILRILQMQDLKCNFLTKLGLILFSFLPGFCWFYSFDLLYLSCTPYEPEVA